MLSPMWVPNSYFSFTVCLLFSFYSSSRDHRAYHASQSSANISLSFMSETHDQHNSDFFFFFFSKRVFLIEVEICINSTWPPVTELHNLLGSGFKA